MSGNGPCYDYGAENSAEFSELALTIFVKIEQKEITVLFLGG